MAKNIVICCDGTGGKFGSRNTNVIRLFALLLHDPVRQVAFYDPGLGTMSPPGALTRITQATTKFLGLAFAYGLTDRIGDAYRHLMETYEDGDAVFLFGFSRGAYTVRALAGLIHMFGMVRRSNENLIPYVTAMFGRHDERRFALAREFKATFSRDCPIHFMGLWDTVSSVGWIYDPIKFPYTANNPSLKVGRHAVSVDERRCFFRQNLWGPAGANQDLRQVWFAGVHSDIGGGYASEESGLANITLRWMLDQATQYGLLVDHQREAQTIALAENQPDPRGRIHRSLEGLWWVLEFWPKPWVDTSEHPPQTRFRVPLGKPRRIPEGSRIHQTVFDRRDTLPLSYRPPNLPQTYAIEPR